MITKLPEHEQRITALEAAVGSSVTTSSDTSASLTQEAAAIKGNVRWRIDVQKTIQEQATTILELKASVSRLERELDTLRLMIYNGGVASTSSNKMDPTN